MTDNNLIFFPLFLRKQSKTIWMINVQATLQYGFDDIDKNK